MYEAICIAELLEQRRGKLSVVASNEFAWAAVLLKYEFQVGDCRVRSDIVQLPHQREFAVVVRH